MLPFLRGLDQEGRRFVSDRIGDEASGLFVYADSVSCDSNSQFRTESSKRKLWSVIRTCRNSPIGLLLRRPFTQQDLDALQVGRFRLLSGEVHRWAFDKCSIKDLLESAGFADVQKCNHGESRIPEWHRFQLELDSNGKVKKPDLMIAEARKPLEIRFNNN